MLKMKHLEVFLCTLIWHKNVYVLKQDLNTSTGAAVQSDLQSDPQLPGC